MIRVMSAVPRVHLADPEANIKEISALLAEANARGAQLCVFPELCLTGYTCGDLFFSDCLLGAVEPALARILEQTAALSTVFTVGLPLRFGGKLYNCAAVVHAGRLLGVVPKTYLPNYGEFYEQRQFSSASVLGGNIYDLTLCGQSVPFGTDLLFACAELPDYTFGVELCEDLWVPCPPSTRLTAGGAAIIANLSASDEVIGKADYRRMLVSATSARLACGYIYCSASPTESTQDMVFSRHHLIAENGTILAENEPFADAELTITEIDVQRLMHERHRTTSYDAVPGMRQIVFHQPLRRTQLTRPIAPNPFVPPYDDQLRARAEAILRIQSQGLKKRIEHTHAKTVVLGISGGLDSTLALLVCVRAFDLCGRSRKQIQCVTMPCFGTTKRTKSNAVKLCEELGVSVQEVNITAAVRQHFADIGHDESVHDVTYENCQARERTQVLMDIANQSGGLVIGTGDLSELALGWATYNADHMSMYGVNAGVPKTLVRYLVKFVADTSEDADLARCLNDIFDTPVSPELLPPTGDGQISQKTEDLVGPYELHDFFLYQILRYGFSPRKVYALALHAFSAENQVGMQAKNDVVAKSDDGVQPVGEVTTAAAETLAAGQAEVYDAAMILKWLRKFYWRFFSQQFKRSCLPDGPKVGSIAVSPRGDLRMPSDAVVQIWIDELKELD